MASISLSTRVPRRAHRSLDASLALALTFLFLLGALCGRSAPAQSFTEGEEFEFTHPLVTESPSPDTKVRFDFIDARGKEDGVRRSERTYRLEAELAFRPWISIEVNVPYVSRRIAGLPTESGIGDAEAALKLASFKLVPHGVLLGGGVELGLPTGDAGDGIGSDHIVEVSPYVDGGYMRGPVELVGFMTMSFATNRRADEPRERALEYNLSGMLHFTPIVAGLLELDGESPLAGEGSRATRFDLSPGVLVHPRVANGHILVGASASFPITHAREFSRRLLFSAFYHF
jgi:hypothetical protein